MAKDTFGSIVGDVFTPSIEVPKSEEIEVPKSREIECVYVSDGVYKYVYKDTGEDVK